MRDPTRNGRVIPYINTNHRPPQFFCGYVCIPFYTLLHFQRIRLKSGTRMRDRGIIKVHPTILICVAKQNCLPSPLFAPADLLTIVDHPDQQGDMCRTENFAYRLHQWLKLPLRHAFGQYPRLIHPVDL